MKVLHAAETIKGGVATVLKQLVAAQQAESSEFDVKCLIPEDQATELDTVEPQRVECWKRNGRSLRALLSFGLAFSKTVLKFKPDIVHLHSSFAGVIGRVCLFALWPFVRPKVVYCPHAFSFLMETSGGKKKVYALIEKLLLPMTDAIICVSDYEANQARLSGIKSKKLFVIHNGVAERPSIVRRNKSENEAIELLFVGRFDYQKGYDLLIKAMHKIHDAPLKLTVIGDAVHGKETIETLPGAVYTGWLNASQMEPWFMQADALIIPSRWEGFAMVPLEAMSYGLPVIASDATSLPEVVKDKETGFLFKSGSVDELAATLSGLKDYDLSVMGERGRAWFSQQFTSQNMIRKTHELYVLIRNN